MLSQLTMKGYPFDCDWAAFCVLLDMELMLAGFLVTPFSIVLHKSQLLFNTPFLVHNRLACDPVPFSFPAIFAVAYCRFVSRSTVFASVGCPQKYGSSGASAL